MGKSDDVAPILLSFLKCNACPCPACECDRESFCTVRFMSCFALYCLILANCAVAAAAYVGLVPI